MAGFVVSPLSPSCSTKRASSPDAMRLRRRPSYQTLCPYRSSSRSGFATCPSSGEARLERANLGEPPRVPLLAVEARGEECVGDLQGERLADDACPEREDVHGVVRAEVEHLVATRAQVRPEALLQRVTRVIPGQGDPHLRLSRPAPNLGCARRPRLGEARRDAPDAGRSRGRGDRRVSTL